MIGKTLASLLIAGAMTAALSGAPSARAATATDRHFMQDAAQGNLAEVEMGRLALNKAIDGDVRQFGQRMIDDHSKALHELRLLARSKRVTVPRRVNAQQAKEMKALSRLSGAAFDRRYVNLMVKDHRKDVSEFHKASAGSDDRDLRRWASQTTPVLESHLRMIERIDRSLRGGKRMSEREYRRQRMGGADRLTDQEKIYRGWH
jgi:putative membrane protein